MFNRKRALGAAALLCLVGLATPSLARTDYSKVVCEDPAIKKLAEQTLKTLTAYDLGITGFYDAPISSLDISFDRFTSFTTKYHDPNKLICNVRLYWWVRGAPRPARGTFNITQFRDGHIEKKFHGLS
jgi:hypothetical protein